MQVTKSMLAAGLLALMSPSAFAEPIPADALRYIRDLEALQRREFNKDLGSGLYDVAKRGAQLSAAVYIDKNYEGGVDGKLVDPDDMKDKLAYASLVNNDDFKIVNTASSVSLGGILHLNSDMKVMILKDAELKRIWVAFRGSSSARNWVKNFEYAQDDCGISVDKCYIHKGFKKAWDSVRDDVKKAIEEARKDAGDYQLTITGHSLGGATAQTAAFYLREDGENADLVTFGQPRVGNVVLVTHLTVKQKDRGSNARFTNSKDFVPHTPPIARVGQSEQYDHFPPQYFSSSGNWEIGDIEMIEDIRPEGKGAEQYGATSVSWDVDVHRNYFWPKLSSGGNTEGAKGSKKRGIIVQRGVEDGIPDPDDTDGRTKMTAALQYQDDHLKVKFIGKPEDVEDPTDDALYEFDESDEDDQEDDLEDIEDDAEDEVEDNDVETEEDTVEPGIPEPPVNPEVIENQPGLPSLPKPEDIVDEVGDLVPEVSDLVPELPVPGNPARFRA